VIGFQHGALLRTSSMIGSAAPMPLTLTPALMLYGKAVAENVERAAPRRRPGAEVAPSFRHVIAYAESSLFFLVKGQRKAVRQQFLKHRLHLFNAGVPPEL